MFFMIGYKEHLLAFKASPFGTADVFQGGFSGLTVGTKAYVMFGEVSAVEAVLDTWADFAKKNQKVELGQLIHKTGVSLLGPVVLTNAQEVMSDGTPALYYYDKGVDRVFQTNVDTLDPYEIASEEDEGSDLVTQLKAAIKDYDKLADRQVITNHITKYISLALNVPDDAEVMYVNFKTSEIYRMNPKEFANAR